MTGYLNDVSIGTISLHTGNFMLDIVRRRMLFNYLSNDVYERRTSTGSGPFSFLEDGFHQTVSQIVSVRVKKPSNTNFISSRHIKREKCSLPVDVRRSKTSLLKLPNRGRGRLRGRN